MLSPLKHASFATCGVNIRARCLMQQLLKLREDDVLLHTRLIHATKENKGKINQQRMKGHKTHQMKKCALLKKNRLKGRVIGITKIMSVHDIAQAANVRPEVILEAADICNFNTHRKTVFHELEKIQMILRQIGLRYKVESSNNSLESVLLTDKDEYRSPLPSNMDNFQQRPPIITIMGHVDHGKTTLLDMLRKSRVAEEEAGGITQKIGAFCVKVQESEQVTFLDTPGHAVFSSMRKRGAQLTDIVVLVVAADDGIMEQTIESIKMAKDAKVPMVVAINKCDSPNAKPKQVIEQLREYDLEPEEDGGHTLVVEISAKTGKGISNLVESILLQAELLNIRADPQARVEGVIVESKQDKHHGPIGSAIIQHGTLKKGMWITAGTAIGRVKFMTDENNVQVQSAHPAMPVNIIGWRSIPPVGEVLLQVPKEARAKEVSEYRKKLQLLEEEDQIFTKVSEIRQKERETYIDVRNTLAAKKEKRINWGEKSSRIFSSTSNIPKFNIVVKADVDGSLDAILEVLQTYDNHDVVQLNVVDSSVGTIKESDIDVAKSFAGVILVFNQTTPEEMIKLASRSSVDVKRFDVIYHLVDYLKTTLSEMIDQDDAVVLGAASVQKTFAYKVQHGYLKVAGCHVENGQLKTTGNFALLRDEEIIHEGPVASLKKGNLSATLVESGEECGITFEDNSVEPQSGDVIQRLKYVRKTLSWNPPGF